MNKINDQTKENPQKVKIAIMIPARNEEARLAETIRNLQEEQTEQIDLEIIVVDDGSHDKTATIAEEMGVTVIQLPDRGYSALGRPELADTHNAGFKYILNKTNADFIAVIGSDTTVERKYFEKIIEEFANDEKLMIAGGYIVGERNRKDEVRGSGRVFRRELLEMAGGRLPRAYAWEPFLVQFAKAKGYKARSLPELKVYTSRKSLQRVNWKNYGIGMKEMGYHWLYAIGRGIFHALKGHPINGAKLIWGYLFGRPAELYPEEIRKAIRKRQLKRIRQIILPF